MNKENKISSYVPKKSQYIGTVLQVTPSTIKGEAVFYNENQTIKFSVSNYIIIDCLTHDTIGQLTNIKEESIREGNGNYQITCSFEADIFATLNYTDGLITSGLQEVPKLYYNIFLADPNLIQRITTRNYQSPEQHTNVLLNIGNGFIASGSNFYLKVYFKIFILISSRYLS